MSALKETEILSKYLGSGMVRGQGLRGENAHSLWRSSLGCSNASCHQRV